MAGNNYLPTEYQTFIHASRYARWLPEENKRESWIETISRFSTFIQIHLKKNLGVDLESEVVRKIEDSIISLSVMPSMRALMTAGSALERENISGYNCSYLPIDSPRSFDEILYILMNGTGVGFSVEREGINQLPTIPDREFEYTEDVISVADSKEGWARAFKDLVSYLYTNRIPKVNVNKIRPAGARLNTFGGRASGPQPLVNLLDFVIEKFKEARGRKLSSMECHDIVCKTGEVVVVGGVRRSALISLSNLSDQRLRSAKSGAWWDTNPERALANNSVAYTEKPDAGIFMKEWLALYESKSGERGIFNRISAKEKAKQNGRRNANYNFGTNPCSEIILRPNQFCNLTEVVVRPLDTLEILLNKIEIATILGTIQATLTNFGYLRKRWQTNTEEERLLGVSLTGIMDNTILNRMRSKLPETLETMRNKAVMVNKEWSEKLGIPQSTAITCVKPSGTVSQLVDSASGIHARHAPYYIRTVRGDNKDPLTEFMKAKGVPCEPDVMNPNHTSVFSFPMKTDPQAIFRNSMSAIEQLEIWKCYAEHWCEHKPSVTISVKENEWVNVGNWCWNNFDHLSGVSFLPFSDHTYQQAPYQDIDKEKYEELSSKMPTNINWSDLKHYETEDNTKGSQELACTAGSCELVDI
jgi:ribonucleoside-triphosphate reductase|tara:strand:- start:1056 stop:2984 length:1929 start_codon:yes stop_codon:yes gene_type:complete